MNLAKNNSLNPEFSHTFKMEQDEIGTKVAAATVAQLKGNRGTEVHINRSFLYAVMHEDTILAHGSVKDESVLLKTRKG